jgi:putative intracellular protease/amidase
MSVLLIVTSHDRLGDTGNKTGLFLEELAAPYYEFKQAGFTPFIASIRGGEAPIDPWSLQNLSDVSLRFLGDNEAMLKVKNTQRLEQIAASGAKFDGYFVVGGHGILWDGPGNGTLQMMLSQAFEEKRIVAAVCHGPAALVNVRLSDGEYLVAGRRVNSFTNEEEQLLKLDKAVPFLLESKLRQRGARFENAAPWRECVIRDENLITGQNPASAGALARQMIRRMELSLARV